MGVHHRTGAFSADLARRSRAPALTDPKPLALLNRSLVVTTVLAALIVAASFWLDARNNSDDEWVVHSLAVRDQLTRVLSLVQSAETGQRGYLLTGRDDYLAPYDASGRAIAGVAGSSEPPGRQ